VSGHTPGPWEVVTILSRRLAVFNGDSAIVRTAGLDETVNAAANARLIAAAPELLDSLRSMRFALNLSLSLMGPEATIAAKALIADADAVIAQAEGK
jgi:hypothetical protein